jgi:hypothetical protein
MQTSNHSTLLGSNAVRELLMKLNKQQQLLKLPPNKKPPMPQQLQQQQKIASHRLTLLQLWYLVRLHRKRSMKPRKNSPLSLRKSRRKKILLQRLCWKLSKLTSHQDSSSLLTSLQKSSNKKLTRTQNLLRV